MENPVCSIHCVTHLHSRSGWTQTHIVPVLSLCLNEFSYYSKKKATRKYVLACCGATWYWTQSFWKNHNLRWNLHSPKWSCHEMTVKALINTAIAKNEKKTHQKESKSEAMLIVFVLMPRAQFWKNRFQKAQQWISIFVRKFWQSWKTEINDWNFVKIIHSSEDNAPAHTVIYLKQFLLIYEMWSIKVASILIAYNKVLCTEKFFCFSFR